MCAMAMVFNAFVESMSMLHFSFKNELLGVKLSIAIKGVIYRKVCLLKLVMLLALTPSSYQRVSLLEVQQTTAKTFLATGLRRNGPPGEYQMARKFCKLVIFKGRALWGRIFAT